jgi:lipopolysaccharide export system ATP-binding protein
MGLLFNLDKLRKKQEETPALDLTDMMAAEGVAVVPEPNVAESEHQESQSEATEVEENPIEDAEPEEEHKLVLRTDNLVKKYGKRTVVNHVSIDVTQGEIVGLLGPNGAGKTTTFYMTVGLIQPNEGRIFLNDLDITKYPVYKRAQNGIGYLAQEPSVFRKLSVEDNIKAVLQMTGRSKEYQKEKLESLISEFRLEKVRKNLGDQLSGGERRRTEIARCLAIDPKFIMLDEPFAGVDPIAVEDIQSIVYKLKEKNIGILITDHNAPETLSITDRAYLLFEGRILFQGTSEELAENPTVREKYLGRNFIFRRKNFE